MRVIGFGVVCLSLLGACATEMAKENRAETQRAKATRAENIAKNDAIWEQRKTYSVSGKTYEVGLAPDKSYALVGPINQETYSLREIEAAARAASGCSAQGDQFLILLGATSDTRLPISTLKNLKGRSRANLTC